MGVTATRGAEARAKGWGWMAGEARDLSTGSAREPSSRGGTACEGGCL